MIRAIVPRKTINNEVNFIEMIEMVATRKWEGYYTIDQRTYKFFCDPKNLKNVDIMVQCVGHYYCDFGYFFKEDDYIQDFTGVKYKMKKISSWNQCTYRAAIKYYQNGFTVRAEIEDDVYQEFSRTKCDMQDAWVVLDDKLDWEWMEE